MSIMETNERDRLVNTGIRYRSMTQGEGGLAKYPTYFGNHSRGSWWVSIRGRDFLFVHLPREQLWHLRRRGLSRVELTP